MNASTTRSLALAVLALLLFAQAAAYPALAQAQPQITSVQILNLGQPVDNLVAGTRARQYRIQITGEGFDPSAKVFLGGRKIHSTVMSATEIIARPSAAVMIPGEASLKVVNPGSNSSNSVTIDIISNPSVLSIQMLSQNVAMVGAQVTISGFGLTPTGNRIRFVRFANPLSRGISEQIDSPDGQTLTFAVPASVCPDCPPGAPCPTVCSALEPAQYSVAVTNANGLSNSLKFVVSSESGPIGIWSDQNVAATVTDTAIDVEGLCFSARVSKTLVTDQAGNFNLSGSYFPLIGPIRPDGIPAQITGTVNGNTMTLTISAGSFNVGPFTLVFGKYLNVVHPCV